MGTSTPQDSSLDGCPNTEYNDFVIEWKMVMTSWVGYIKGSYQTTGQTPSVWLDPWPHCFTLVIDGDGHHKE